MGLCSVSEAQDRVCELFNVFSPVRLISFHTRNIVSKQNQFGEGGGNNILERATAPHVFVVFI